MIWCVEDDASIRDIEVYALRSTGFEACGFADGAAFWQALQTEEQPELVVLDVMLPGVDGFALMDYITPTGTPVIFLTARASVEDRVRGLRAGAYDYIVKPFAAEELLARVDGLMRHTGRRRQTIRVWGIEIQPESRTVTRDGAEIRLKPKEYDLLMVLVYNRGIALYRDVLLERVWGLDCDVMPRTLDIHISRLRKKLGWGSQLRAVPKIGYLLEEEP